MKSDESDLYKESENIDDKIFEIKQATKNMDESVFIKRTKDFDKMENNLVGKLKKLCEKTGRGKEPLQSAEYLHKLGRIYLERSTTYDDGDDSRLMMVSLIRSACLLNAAIVRKPQNIQEIKDNLKELCCKVLINAGASDKNADLIGQSELVRRDIDTMRDMVRQRLHDIQLSDKKITDKKEKEANKIVAIRSLQKDITSSYTKVMADLLRFCQTVMGDPPCNFSLVGMGSLARKEITPYSDFEHIIVLEENSEHRSDYDNVLNYFRWLSVIFQIVVINLQETIIPCVNISSLIDQKNKHWFYDEVTKHGICFDSMSPHAWKFPLGRIETTENNQSTTELIKSVDEMLKYLSVDEDLKNGYHLKDILTKVCYVGGDKSIFDKFQTKVYDSLKREIYDERIESIKQLLIEDLDNFATRSKLLDLTSTSFNLKKDFYRSSTLFISALGQLHNVEASSCFDISEKLEERNVISKDMKHYQMYAVALACELRLKWYMKQNEQDDFIEKKGESDSVQLLLETMKSSSVIKYFQITYALQCDISKTFGLKKIHFYADPKLMNCKLYYRFRKFQKFQNFIKTFTKAAFDKTARLYSSEEIMNQLQNESKLQELKKESDVETKTNVTELIFDLGEWFQTQESYDEAVELFQIYLDLIKTRKSNYKTTDNQQHRNVLNNIGLCLMDMQRPGEAITYLKELLTIEEKASLNINADVSFVTTLNNIGTCLMEMQKPDEAISYLQRSLSIKENSSFDLNTDVSCAHTLNNIGTCLVDMHKPGEAIIYIQRSMTIYENTKLDISMDVGFAHMLNNIGKCLMDMHKPGEAITYLQRSLTTYENASLDVSTDVTFAHTLNNMGLCLMNMQKLDEAITYLQRSMKVKEKASLDISMDLSFARTLNNIGKCLMDMEKPGEAITYLQRSMAIDKKVSLDINADINFAQTLNNIGTCLVDLQKTGEAITYLQRALTITENTSFDINTNVSFATMLNNIGMCLMKIQKPEEAITYLQRSLTIEENASFNINTDVNFAQSLNNIGLCLMDMQKPEEAITYLQRSLTIEENASLDISTNVNFAQLLNDTGSCFIEMHKFDQAITYLQRSLTIFESSSFDINSNGDFAHTLNNIGLCLMRIQKPGEALSYLQRSLTIVKNASFDINTDLNFAQSLINIGKCLMKMQKPDEAITYLQKSLTIYEKVSLDINTDVSLAAIMNSIGLCLTEVQKPEEAIVYLQRSMTIKENASHVL